MCGIFAYFNDTIEEGQIDFICFLLINVQTIEKYEI